MTAANGEGQTINSAELPSQRHVTMHTGAKSAQRPCSVRLVTLALLPTKELLR